MDIRELYFKDDSFRTYNWFTLQGSSYVTVPSTGDEITIAQGVSPLRVLPSQYHFPTFSGQYCWIRAKTTGSNSYVSVYLEGASTTSACFFSAVSSQTYALYSAPVQYNYGITVNNINIDVAGDPAVIDFIAVDNGTHYDYGGATMQITMDKYTVSQPIPNAGQTTSTYDIIQQLGMPALSYVLTLPGVSRNVYEQIVGEQDNGTPMLFNTPVHQVVGYLVDTQAHTEAGWIGMTVDGWFNQQVYDVTTTLIKADQDIDNSVAYLFP